MIYDSGIWKIELKKRTDDFNKLVQETEFSLDWYSDEEDDGLTASYKFFIELQKYCFYSAVITRKFLESNRLSDELRLTKYSVNHYKKKTEKILTKDNFDSVDEEYETKRKLTKHLTLEKICHLFIHSFIFTPKLIEYKIDVDQPDDDIENWEITGVSGVYINTDRYKEKEVYFFGLDFILKLFTEVYTDNIVYISEDRFFGKVIRSRNYPEDYEERTKK